MIVFLHGDDEFRSLEKLAEIKKRFQDKNRESFALETFDFSDGAKDVEEVVMKASMGGLFSPKKLVVVKNLIFSKAGEENKQLLSFLNDKKRVDSKELIIVFWEGKGVIKKSKIFKLLAKISKSQEFSLLSGAKLVQWIKGQVEKAGEGAVSIGNQEAEMLAAYVGNEMFQLNAEIKKLVGYKGKGEVREKDIELLVRSKVESDIFKTIDALARRDKKSALQLLHNHLEAGDDPFYLLSMYFFQFRNLLRVKSYEKKQASAQEVASALKMHPYVARKSMEQARFFSSEKLKSLYQSLCGIDYRSKTGRTEIVLALDMFVAMV